jgi:hypothetical protein
VKRRDLLKGAAASAAALPSLGALVGRLPEIPKPVEEIQPYVSREEAREYAGRSFERVHLLVNGHPIRGIRHAELEVRMDRPEFLGSRTLEGRRMVADFHVPTLTTFEIEFPDQIQAISFPRIYTRGEEVTLCFQAAASWITCSAYVTGFEHHADAYGSFQRIQFAVTSELVERPV